MINTTLMTALIEDELIVAYAVDEYGNKIKKKYNFKMSTQESDVLINTTKDMIYKLKEKEGISKEETDNILRENKRKLKKELNNLESNNSKKEVTALSVFLQIARFVLTSGFKVAKHILLAIVYGYLSFGFGLLKMKTPEKLSTLFYED